MAALLPSQDSLRVHIHKQKTQQIQTNTTAPADKHHVRLLLYQLVRLKHQSLRLAKSHGDVHGETDDDHGGHDYGPGVIRMSLWEVKTRTLTMFWRKPKCSWKTRVVDVILRSRRSCECQLQVSHLSSTTFLNQNESYFHNDIWYVIFKALSLFSRLIWWRRRLWKQQWWYKR